MSLKKFLIGTFIILFIVVAFFVVIYFSVDRTAEFKGRYLYWNNAIYEEKAGAYSEGNTIAMTTDNKWSVNEVKGDDLHTFVVVRSFLDQYLYVKKDYKIPQNGKVSSAYIHTYNRFENIIDSSGETFTFNTDNIYAHAETIDLGYDGCPVGTHFVGLIGVVKNKWVYISTLPTDIYNTDGSRKAYNVTCKIINDEKSLTEIQKYIKYSVE